MYKVKSLNYECKQRETLKNFLKDGISLISPNNNLIKDNKFDLSKLRKDLEQEFKLKKYPQALSLKVFLKDVKLLKDCPYDLLLCTSFRDFL